MRYWRYKSITFEHPGRLIFCYGETYECLKNWYVRPLYWLFCVKPICFYSKHKRQSSFWDKPRNSVLGWSIWQKRRLSSGAGWKFNSKSQFCKTLIATTDGNLKIKVVWLLIFQFHFQFVDIFSGFSKYVKGIRKGEFCWKEFFTGLWELKEWFWWIKPFSKLKTSLSKY